VVLYAAPDTRHPLFENLARRHPLELRPQRGIDLGERMCNAARECLKDAGIVLLTGTDAPTLGSHELGAAVQALRTEANVVMVPAEDGGYVLLGVRGDHPHLFNDMPWGSERVAAVTRQRCGKIGLKLVELPVCWDVDRPQDLARLVAAVPDFAAWRRDSSGQLT